MMITKQTHLNALKTVKNQIKLTWASFYLERQVDLIRCSAIKILEKWDIEEVVIESFEVWSELNKDYDLQFWLTIEKLEHHKILKDVSFMYKKIIWKQ